MSIHKCESTLMSQLTALSKGGVNTLQIVNEITHTLHFRFCISLWLETFFATDVELL
jgi:hypothetical protein